MMSDLPNTGYNARTCRRHAPAATVRTDIIEPPTFFTYYKKSEYKGTIMTNGRARPRGSFRDLIFQNWRPTA